MFHLCTCVGARNLDSLYLNQPQTLCEQTYTSCTYYHVRIIKYLSRATIGEGFSTGLESTHSFLKDNRFLKIKISVNHYSNTALFREDLESVVILQVSTMPGKCIENCMENMHTDIRV